jgi:hypothetical protein
MTRLLVLFSLILAPTLAGAQEMTTNRHRPACLGENGELTAVINGPHQKRHRKAALDVVDDARSDDLNIYGAPNARFKIEFFTPEWKIKPASGSACEVQWLRAGEAGDWSAFAYVDTALGDSAVRSCLRRALDHALCKDSGQRPRVAY